MLAHKWEGGRCTELKHNDIGNIMLLKMFSFNKNKQKNNSIFYFISTSTGYMILLKGSSLITRPKLGGFLSVLTGLLVSIVILLFAAKLLLSRFSHVRLCATP